MLSFRQYTRNVHLSVLSHLEEVLPQRLMGPLRPAMVRIRAHTHAHRRHRGLHFMQRRDFHSGPFRLFCPARAMADRITGGRCFSTLRLQYGSTRPCLFHPNYLYSLSNKSAPVTVSRAFSTIFASFFSRERHSLPSFLFSNSRVSDAFQKDLRAKVAQNYSRKFLHSHGTLPKPIEVFKNGYKGHPNRLKFARARPLNPPSFIFPRPSLESSTASYSTAASLKSSLPSLSELARAFHATPETGSYVDFDLTPQITIPPVTQLSPDIIERVTDDIERHIAELRAMAENVRKLATLGELPVSVEDRSLRIYFPNCEPEQVNSLLNSAEVTQGVIRSHNDSNIVSPVDSSSESSYILNTRSSSPSSSTTSEPYSGDGFYYTDMESVSRRNSISSSSGSWDITHLRGFGSPSAVTPSIPAPSLTNSPSTETISEGSSYFY